MAGNSRPAAPGPSVPPRTRAPDFPQSPAASAAPLVLFETPPRDYSRFRRENADLANPWLVYARHQARLHGEAHGWTTQMHRCADRGLIAVLSGHASGERIRRSDLAASERVNKIFGRRLADILGLLGLLNDDRLPALDTWITATTRSLTPGIRDGVHHWLTVLREGTPRHRPKSPLTVYNHLHDALPALTRTRWPTTANPHLLVTRSTASGCNPSSHSWIKRHFTGLTATIEQMRVDRQLEEALSAGPDPLHLAAVFGISDQTAIRYAHAARQLLTE
jgi:hypothetical protein